MRIAHFAPYPTPYRLALWSEIAERCELTVWVYSFGTRPHPWSLELPSHLDLRVARTAAVHLRRMETPLHALQGWRPAPVFDAVVVNEWPHPAAWQIARWAARHATPFVLEFESTMRDHRHRRGVVDMARRRFVRGASVCLVPGEDARRAVMHAGAPPDRVVLGSLAPDLARFDVRVLERDERQGLGHRFVFVGRLVPLKNVDILLRAFARVRDDGDELVIVGAGPQKQALERLRDQLGVPAHFLGQRDPAGVSEVLATSHTLVLPSEHEVWGMAAAEAAAAGLHVVISDHAGIASELDDERGVFIVPPRLVEVADGMAASRAAWTGPVMRPRVLQRSPAVTAATYIRACELAASANGQ